jgi:hypothetical protein
MHKVALPQFWGWRSRGSPFYLGRRPFSPNKPGRTNSALRSNRTCATKSSGWAIKLSDVRLEEIFAHVSENPPHASVFFNVAQMRRWLRQIQRPTTLFSIDPAVAKLLFLHRGVSLAKMQALTVIDLQQPLIFVRWTETSKLLIDGHHRYVMASELRMTHMPGWLVDVEDGKRFVIEDMPDGVRERGVADILARTGKSFEAFSGGTA